MTTERGRMLGEGPRVAPEPEAAHSRVVAEAPAFPLYDRVRNLRIFRYADFTPAVIVFVPLLVLLLVWRGAPSWLFTVLLAVAMIHILTRRQTRRR